jgi:hypothetical protein
MTALGWDAHGLSLVPESESSRGCEGAGVIEHGRIQDLEAAHRYDAITLWHVLEHLSDPVTDLTHLSKLLVPSGWLGIGIPVMDSEEARILGPAWLGFDVPRHLLFFTRDRLRRFLSERGFDMVGMYSETRTRVIELSLPQADLKGDEHATLSDRKRLKALVRRWASEDRNGMVVAWARKRAP